MATYFVELENVLDTVILDIMNLIITAFIILIVTIINIVRIRMGWMIKSVILLKCLAILDYVKIFGFMLILNV